MSKSDVIRGKFRIDVYNYEVNIVVCPNLTRLNEEVRRMSRKLSIEEPSRDVQGYVIMKGGIFYVFFSREQLSWNVLFHECDHIRFFIMEADVINDHEASAHLSAYIQENVLRFLQAKKMEITY